MFVSQVPKVNNFMKEDPQFIPSELKVTASENLDISADLQAESDKTIAELIDKDEEKNEENTKK